MPNDENTGLTQEEVETLETLQGNEYTAEYFWKNEAFQYKAICA